MISPTEIKKKALKVWDSQRFLQASLTGESIFPLDIPFRKVTARKAIDDFSIVRAWMKGLVNASKDHLGYGYSIEYKQSNHQQLGEQYFPSRIYFSSNEEFLKFIGKQREYICFQKLIEQTLQDQPALRAWLEKKPLKCLEHQAVWPQLMMVCKYFQDNPRPGYYTRELDIAGVDSKFVEQNKGILRELLDQLLPDEAIDSEVKGLASHGFERRYGLKYDEPLIRFRILDARLAGDSGLTDISVPISQFRKLDLPCKQIYITENKTNGLSFPPVKGAIIIFGLGYGVSSLATVDWLGDREILYWGDIDTHGFSILSQLRSYFTKAKSFLMDRKTLLTFQNLWVTEPEDKRCVATLLNLNQAEQNLYVELQNDVIGKHIRLEQERISMYFLQKRLANIKPGFQVGS
ncbi:MAG TPA: hypothetical protein ENI64_06570 [Gammaproteobacteria bacterium]|nr:hypothetical protein [Gammaproteobacteria bacterium]